MTLPKTKQPAFKMISCTEDPVETLFAAWMQSRPNSKFAHYFKWLDKNRPDYGGVVTAGLVKDMLQFGILAREDMEEVFKTITAMSIPVSESIHITWGFTNLPIEWREQAVRKRQWGFWLTSMREFGMDDFADDGRYAPPAPGAVPEDNGGLEFFHDLIKQLQDGYVKLKKEYDWPQEIARKVIPSCATHNGNMFSTYRTLLETVKSRTCWVAQVDLWAPVLRGMITQLREKHALMGMIISPPCFDRYSDEYKGCAYKAVSDNRLNGEDPYAVCPIYAYNEDLCDDSTDSWEELMRSKNVGDQYIAQGRRLLPIWQDIWGRDPFTGELT